MFFGENEHVLVRTERTILTDKRLIIMTGEKPKRHDYSIMLHDIVEIEIDRGGMLKKQPNVLFRLFLSNGRVHEFHGGKKSDSFEKWIFEACFECKGGNENV